MVGRQNADIADTLHQGTLPWQPLSGFRWAITSGRPMTASDMLFDSRGWVFGVKLSDEDIADFEVLRDFAIATIFLVSIYGMHIGATWQIRHNRSCAAAMRPYISNYIDHLLL